MSEETLAKALRHYGREAQMLKAVEELAELQVELLHHLGGRGDQSRLCSETADVLIMAGQLRLMLGSARVDGYVHSKLNRLDERMSA